MTTQKSFKRRIRERMAKTGESYTAARRQLLPPETSPLLPDHQRSLLMHSEDAVQTATGHGWEHWVASLDDWGATARTHTEIARWLVEENAVPRWWAQGITVSYERIRGMRQVGETSDGFTATASKTIAASADRVFDAFEDEGVRSQWLPTVVLARRTATRPNGARYDWLDDPADTLLVVNITVKGEDKSAVAIQHAKLPSPDEMERLKLWWRARLTELKAHLEAP